MFEGIDDDDLFSPPMPSSNLASIFGKTMVQPKSTNSSLIYTAPKQPTTKSEESLKQHNKSKPPSSVILFKEVKAFRASEENLVAQGVCGFALIGNEGANIFHLLLYKQKNNIISTSRIYKNFLFTIQSDNYATFSDDNKTQWRVHFNSESDLKEFSAAIKKHDGRITFDSVPKAEENNDVQSDSSGNIVRANILSRMAKVGQKLLPNNQKPSSDSDSDDNSQKSVPRKPKRSENFKVTPSECTSATNQNLIMNGQFYPIPQNAMMAYAPQTMISDPLQVFFAENRTHNSEVRMNMVRLTNKMEEMIEKFNKYEYKTDKNDHETTIEQQKKLIDELKLKSDSDTKIVSELQLKVTTSNMTIEELTSKFNMLLEENTRNLAIMERKNRAIADLQSEISSNTNLDVEDKLKKSMNVLFHAIISQIADEDSYTGSEIKTFLAKEIRKSTLEMVKSFNSDENVTKLDQIDTE